ncbi:MAG: universal stress protein [Gammaproteobacteria bacterium]|nr:universal stress protein [Gammaproteobacteria bacterium]NIR98277.1 universal stress protein [Gammaproteobacteria bacterium]NIT63952.1 universal stress protein [Gammaproteobacteria bacterium]NIV20950.1 universal stress protein [Gammaproteobacteria bacterium]NIX10241.1 universal stress protein [Gammaproteobacteria bacterium]
MVRFPAYRTILCATDLLPVARRAAQIAECLGAWLVLVHVIDHFPVDGPTPGPGAPQDRFVQEAQERLDALGRRLVGWARTRAFACVTRGPASDKPAQLVELEGADLLVVGSWAEETLTGALGTAAGALVESTACDVLLVRP